jgi:hypothetical protein
VELQNKSFSCGELLFMQDMEVLKVSKAFFTLFFQILDFGRIILVGSWVHAPPIFMWARADIQIFHSLVSGEGLFKGSFLLCLLFQKNRDA